MKSLNNQNMANSFTLEIISPKKKLLTVEANSVTVPSVSGELTILKNHIPLFSLLREGIIKISYKNNEDFFSIGSGYIETTGSLVRILVSEAYNQREIDEKMVERAIIEAEKKLKEAPTVAERKIAMSMYRRSLVDSKLLKRKRKNIQ